MIYDNIDLAWIAGFFDGEGCVYAYHSFEPFIRKNGRHTQTLQTSITNTNKVSLDYVQMLFGGKVELKDKGKNKPCYVWRGGGRDNQKRFLQAILPFLKIKQSQVELALQFLNTVVDNSMGIRTPENIISLRTDIISQLKVLKKI